MEGVFRITRITGNNKLRWLLNDGGANKVQLRVRDGLVIMRIIALRGGGISGIGKREIGIQIFLQMAGIRFARAVLVFHDRAAGIAKA